MKICTKCKDPKPLTDFRPHPTTKDGYTSRCVGCTALYNKKYRDQNSVHAAEYAAEYQKNHADRLREYSHKYANAHREQAKQRTKRWNESNPDKKRENNANYYNKNRERELEKSKIKYQKNKEVFRARSKQWKLDNPDKVAANLAKRRAAKKQAIPQWADLKAIKLLYKKAQQMTEGSGIEYQVDHIVPLNSKIVCGLHCEDNLRVITAEENNSKNNKLLEELL